VCKGGFCIGKNEVGQVGQNLNLPTECTCSSNNVNPTNNHNGSTDLDWIVNAVADIQKPKPKFSIEQQPVSYDELVKWNEIIDRRWSQCATKKIIKTCSINGDRHFLRINYNRCNDRNFCPRCAWYNARSEAWTTWYWLKHNIVTCMPFKVYFEHIVLTIPHDVDLNDKEVVEAVDKAMAHPNPKCKTTYCYVIQNYSSKNPLSKHQHVHVLALNIGMVEGVISHIKKRKKTKNERFSAEHVNKHINTLQFRRLRPYFNVDRLRQVWKEALLSQLKKRNNDRTLPLPFSMLPKKQLDLHVAYCSFFDKGQAIHWLSYMYRYQV